MSWDLATGPVAAVLLGAGGYATWAATWGKEATFAQCMVMAGLIGCGSGFILGIAHVWLVAS